ncbi:MAG TPA: PTS sugar transporter subunit IIA [Myxococcota bacterium]|nr:PTS sugar transporter subunit IIA [Myxococcota bacterium]HRY95320.1 PTS sugar transporter subunit IIA [Myxococcota bacterium]HSA20774.1 PTS sugar transporter subunit IIA [Myxococcota bacterium]
MRIASILDRNDVTAAVPVGTKREVLAALVDLIQGNHPELDRAQLLNVLLRREELRSTGIEAGVAFPHGRVPHLKNLLACFGRCRKGVPFDSFDGRPTHFFVVLLVPEDAEGSHLKALARLNRMFQDAGFRERLLAAPDAGALHALILEQDEKG